MGTVVTVVLSVYFFIIAYRLQFAYFFFVFLIPFLPKYIGFGVGSEGFSLSLERILLTILFMAAALLFTQHSKHMVKRILLVYHQNKMLVNLLLLLFVFKVFSLLLNSGELSLYVMLFNDFLFSIFIFILTILLIDTEEAIHHLARIFFYSYTVVLILVIVETVVKFPLLSIFASGQMELSRDFTESFYRGGRYRANGSFVSPIMLGEYLVMLFPLIIAYIKRRQHSLTLKIIYSLLFLYAIYSTGSRSALLMSVALVYIYFILILYRGGRFPRYIANLINLLVVILVAYIVFNYISNLIMHFTGRFDKITDEAVRSSTSRALQYIREFDKISEAPLFGFGRTRNFTDLLGSAIDNYYFWLALEVGIVGIFIYLAFLYSLVKTAFNQYKKPFRNYYLLPLLISVLISILFQFLMANPANHIFLYIFVGLISVMKVLQNDNKNNNEVKH